VTASPAGKILTLCISDKKSQKRIFVDTIVVDKKGIIGDKFHNKDIKRSILITSKESYLLALKEGIEMSDGALGENIMIDYNPYHLPSGTKLKIGTALLQISQNCTICGHLSCVDKRLPALLKNDRGIFAQVIQEGEIRKDDKIFIVEELS
jgi:MOSC domain-containing protein YiiM